MAILSELCNLPDGWVATLYESEKKREIGLNKKQEWKVAKRAEHERLLAFRARMKKRGYVLTTTSVSRGEVYRETMPEELSIESGRKMFSVAKGVRQPKRVKNGYSREQAGTIGRTIVTKRFANSRAICVCKSIVY